MENTQTESPQMLLDSIVQQTFTKELATYTAESQMLCRKQCEDNVAEEEKKLQLGAEKGEREAMSMLTQDSIDALEKQCNKLCLHRMMQSFLVVHKFN